MARRTSVLAVGLMLVVALGACSTSARSANTVTLRLGYFPNLTHAPAIAGAEKGLFARELAGKATLEIKTFNAGPEAVQALFSDALDIAYIGPNPAINAYVQSKGEAIRVIAGAVSGGAAFVVKPSIRSAADLKGKTIASPQLGNTQDVALRSWLKEKGLSTTKTGGGDVKVKPQPNSQTLETFLTGDIDGAWVPEPWATRLVQEGRGRVLVDESTLWPGGRFVTTHVIVRTAFLTENPGVVEAFLRGHVAAIDYLNAGGDAQTVVNEGLKELTGTALKPAVIAAAWRNLTFTADPVAASLQTSAANAVAVDLLKPVELNGIYSLDLLNRVLTAGGKPLVAA